MAEEKSAEELREAAAARLPQKEESAVSVNSYFAPKSASYERGIVAPRDHTLPAVRVEASLAERIGEFGNSNSLGLSESVRTLLDTGLTTWEATEEGTHHVQEDQ